MDSEFLKINCLCFYVIFDLLHHHLSNFDEYKCIRLGDGLIVDLNIDGKNIRINLTNRWMKNIDVCLVGCWMNPSNEFSYAVSKDAQYYWKYFPTVPIIIVCGHAEWKYDPGEMKKAELKDDKMMSREIGDKLARELGAVKYIEYSNKTGRGVKILIDEIAFAGIGKINNDEKRRNIEKCNIM